MMTMMMTTPCSRSEVCFQAEKGIGVSGSAAAHGFNDDNDDNDAEEEGLVALVTSSTTVVSLLLSKTSDSNWEKTELIKSRLV